MKLPTLGTLALLKIRLRALAAHDRHQAEIAKQLARLNDTLETLYKDQLHPVIAREVADTAPASFEDEVASLAEAADAEQTLLAELGRTPTVEEILERVAERRERQRTVGDRR